MTYDLVILGGGPAGYRAAELAGHHGLATLLIEKNALGGVCLNEGCVPSKTLLQSAKLYDYAKGESKKYGVTSASAAIDQKAVIARKDGVVKMLVSGIAAQMKKNKVTVMKTAGTIKERSKDGIVISADGQDFIAKHLIIATGSESICPKIDDVENALKTGFALTNKEILSLTDIPKTLTIIGGGVIGLEMASYYQSVGCQVTVIEMLSKIAGPVDTEISALLQKQYEKKGVTFLLDAKVTKVENGTVSYEKDGKTSKVKAEKVLLSIGRKAVTTGIGLENIGVTTERGAILTDDRMKTNVAGVFAAGDVNGKSMLAHTAYREAEVAVNTILGKKDTMRYNAVPSVIYTNPEVASVGETAETATAKGLDFTEKKIPMQFSGRYVAENEGGEGICKVLLEKGSEKILGVSMIANPASEIIFGMAIAIERELRAHDLQKVIFPHPSVAEIFREAIF